MEHDHLDQAALDRLLALDRTEDQNRALLHQLALCPECYKVGGYLLEIHRAGILPPLFSVTDVSLARSRSEAPALWATLERLSQSRRLALVQTERPFLSWGLCERLCSLSKDAAPEDAAAAIHMADLAAQISESLEDDEPAEDRWLYQLRAYAWAHLANAHRASSDLVSAEKSFGVADQWWEAGEMEAGDALGYGAQIRCLKASLRCDQRRFEEALHLLDQAFKAFFEGDPEYRDLHMAGRVLVTKSWVLSEQGEPDRAIPVLEKAEELIDPAREPRLILCARHNLLDNLSKAGRFSEGRALLPQVRELSRSAGSQLDRVRLRWVEARIAAGLGEADEARRAFSEAQRGFLDQSIAYDAALVSLEMATFLLQEGHTAEVRELTREMIPIFQAQDIHREALAALAVFQAAAALDAATVELAREVQAFLARARHDPGLRFQEDRG